MTKLLYALPPVAFASLGLVALGCLDNRGLCEAQVDEICAFVEDCCEEDEREAVYRFFAGGYVSGAGECRDRLRPSCVGAEASDEAVANGRAEFDREVAQKCLDGMKAAREECKTSELFEACDEPAMKGLVKDGDECAADAECADDGICEIDADEDGFKDVDEELGTIEGECRALPGDGDECDDGQCQDDLFCNDANECEERKGAGDPCDGFNFDECKDELFCNDDGECEKLRGKGDACTSPDQCESFDCNGDGECEDNEPEICKGK